MSERTTGKGRSLAERAKARAIRAYDEGRIGPIDLSFLTDPYDSGTHLQARILKEGTSIEPTVVFTATRATEDSISGETLEDIERKLHVQASRENLRGWGVGALEVGALIYGARNLISGLRHKNISKVTEGTAVLSSVLLLESRLQIPLPREIANTKIAAFKYAKSANNQTARLHVR